MNVWRLVMREISHRKLNFALGLCSVTVAVACLVGAQTLLQADRIATDAILSAKQQKVEQAIAERQKAVEQAGAALQDAMRKHMKGLGFNVLILPQDQDLAELHLNGTLSETMPEQYVHKLANSSIMTVNHLLPTVTKRLRWPERDLEIILNGVRGEVPIMHRGLKKPLLQAVPPGTMAVGYQVHRKLGLAEGDKVALLGREFTVTQLYEQRGEADDVSVWIDLAEAQELLGMENLVNAILALECDCAGDRITQIRDEIVAILPGTQVIERYSKALARAEARGKAKEAAEEALKREKQAGAAALGREEAARGQLEQRHASFAAVLVPLVIVGSAVWIGFLAFGNVRQRSEEIGILRAIGLRSRQIVMLFLGKALLMGLLGAVVGCAGGLMIGLLWGGLPASSETSHPVFASGVLLTVAVTPILAPLLSGIASWIPAVLAAQQDPAVVLQGE